VTDRFRLIRRAIAGFAICLVAMPVSALDALRFRLQGGDQALADRLGAASLLVEAYDNDTRNPEDLLAAARADYARVLQALYAEGYYGGTISIRIDGREAADIDPLATLSRVGTIEVIVRPGPPYRFSRAEISPLARGTELPEDFSVGELAKTTVIVSAAGAAVDGWRALGNPKADVSGQQVTANHASDSVAAAIEIAPGPRLRFGDLVVRGRSSLSDRRIRKIAGLPTGELYSPDAVERSARRLRETGVFRSAALTQAEVPNPDGTLDIIAQVSDQEPRRFGFGAEYETSEGVNLSAFWLHRNILGGGERLRFDAEINGIAGDSGDPDYLIGVELVRPATPDAKTDAFVNAELESLDEDTYSSDNATVGIGFTREINDVLTGHAGLDYRYSRVTDGTGETTYRQFFFPAGLIYDRRDDILDTTDGYYVNVEVAPFLGVGGSESGTQADLDARGFQHFGEDRRFVVAARVQAGSIMGASITGLPNDLRYFSGGGGTVRGQEFESLFLDLGDGLLTGGRSFLGLQSEIRAKVADSIQLVGFYDWGTISEDSLPGSDGESHSGAGLGLRYLTGIGPLRFDVGFPVSGPDDTDSFQLYIGIGQAF
jgi:translocation and assembly module TamA